MFRQFYNMGKNPFAKGISPHDVYASEDMAQAHSRLDYLLKTGGIGLLTGDPGTGKTLAIRTWAEKLNPNTTKLVYTCMSTVTNMDFYRQLASGLGLNSGFKKSELFEDIQSCIKVLADERRMRVVIVIDEAHFLPGSVLRDLQMLTNFDMDSRDLVSLVLVGHSVLAQYLSRQPNESLRQRLVVNYKMAGLTEGQAKDYVKSMLAIAGCDAGLFDDAALASAYGASAGSVRVLNAIITNALTIGAQNKASYIDAEMVRCAADEMTLL